MLYVSTHTTASTVTYSSPVSCLFSVEPLVLHPIINNIAGYVIAYGFNNAVGKRIANGIIIDVVAATDTDDGLVMILMILFVDVC